MVHSNNSTHKIFIIGLPRTGTTSVCCKFLELGYKVAHTAYTQKAFDKAQVIADTPIFNDYQKLDQYYPQSKFIYLDRELSLWLPSIKQLLQRMSRNLLREDGGFNPYIKESYQNTFSPFSQETITDDKHLSQWYINHKNSVKDYFKHRESDLLTINVSHDDDLQTLGKFLSIPIKQGCFERINIGGKVTAWKDLKHLNKIESTKNGRISPLYYRKK